MPRVLYGRRILIGPSFSIAQGTFPCQPILKSKMAQLAGAPKFVALASQTSVEFRHCD